MYFGLGETDWERNIFGRIAANSFFIQCTLPIIAMFVYISHNKAHVVYGEAYGWGMSVSERQCREGRNWSTTAPPLSALLYAD